MSESAPTLQGSGPAPEAATSAPGPLRELVLLAAPTVAAMTSYTAMQFTDKWICSKIGPEPIYVGAQVNGGVAAWVPISIAMGTLMVVNTYVSQNMGAGKPERAPAYAWNALWISLAWAVLLIPYGVALPWLFTAVGHEPRLVELESQYGQILVFGAALTMATRAVSQFFYGLHNPGVVLVASLVANAVNFVLTWGLVFGAWGLPKLGVAGSAIGTVIATGVELAIPMAVFLSRSYNERYGTRAPWRPSLPHIRDIVKIGWPSGLMFGNEMVCWAIFMVVLVGKFGPLHSTAGGIAHQWMTVSFMPTVGLTVAITAVVGKYMGMKRPDLARRRALLGTGIAVAYMATCAAAYVLFGERMIGLFIESGTPADEAATVIALGTTMLLLTATFQIFDAVAMCTSAALRGAGDTFAPGVATVVLSWVILVGMGVALVEFAPHLESVGPYIAASAYIILLCLYLLGRFLSGKWMSMRLLEHAAPPAEGERVQAVHGSVPAAAPAGGA